MAQNKKLAIPFEITISYDIYDTLTSDWLTTQLFQPEIFFSNKINLDWSDIPKSILVVNANIDMMILRINDNILIISKEVDDLYPDPIDIQHTTNNSFTYKYAIFYLKNLHYSEEAKEWLEYQPDKFFGCSHSQFDQQFRINNEIVSDFIIEDFYPKQTTNNFEFQQKFRNSRRDNEVTLIERITLKSQ
jgi:hypothetical protein